MVESAGIFSQLEYDANLGLPLDLRGSLSQEAQLARLSGMMEMGVPEDAARELLGLYEGEEQAFNNLR